MNKRESGILVVNRPEMLRSLKRFGGIQQQEPSVALTHEEVFRRYRGFDGEPWPERDHPQFDIENGLAPLSSMADVRQYVDRIDSLGECDVILVDATMSTATVSVDDLPTSFLGFDVGMFDSEWSHCSSILCEVLLGQESEMRSFAARLNEFFLLSTVDDVHELLALRESLLRRGAALEDCDVFRGFAISAL